MKLNFDALSYLFKVLCSCPISIWYLASPENPNIIIRFVGKGKTKTKTKTKTKPYEKEGEKEQKKGQSNCWLARVNLISGLRQKSNKNCAIYYVRGVR